MRVCHAHYCGGLVVSSVQKRSRPGGTSVVPVVGTGLVRSLVGVQLDDGSDAVPVRTVCVSAREAF